MGANLALKGPERGEKVENGGVDDPFWHLRDNGVYGTTPMTLDRPDINGLLAVLGEM